MADLVDDVPHLPALRLPDAVPIWTGGEGERWSRVDLDAQVAAAWTSERLLDASTQSKTGG